MQAGVARNCTLLFNKKLSTLKDYMKCRGMQIATNLIVALISTPLIKAVQQSDIRGGDQVRNVRYRSVFAPSV